MHNKIYEKLKKFINENIVYIVVFVLTTFIINIDLPYYISTPGGIINVGDKIKIENNKESSGTFNMTYVTSYDAKVLTMIIAKFNKDWLIEKKEDVILENENEKDDLTRSHILLKEGSQNAVIYAYNKANRKIELKDTKDYVIYVDNIAETSLKVGDIIEEVEGLEIKSKEEIQAILDKHNYGEEIIIKTNNGIKSAKIQNIENNKKIGILISTISTIETDPKISFNYKDSESGSSGGLMSTLYIYDSLVDYDVTRNKKIAGTGTIDVNGNVGEISGVKFKLIGAVKNKAEIFFVPKENYEEAISLKNDRHYKIDIVCVETFDQALNYLQNLECDNCN